MTLELIDKQDGFQIVRDVIATILVTEITSQQALALAAGKDPDLWKVRVYTERSNCLEQWLDDVPEDTSPICNIWFDQSYFPENMSNVVSRQKSETIYNLDCYGYGVSSDDPSGGHDPGDREAAFESHRATMLVRNILMAGEYTYLGLRGTVWQRYPVSIQSFQPEFQSQGIQQIAATRFSLRVGFNEFSPQVTGETLEYISATVKRGYDGLVTYFTADYDYS